MTPQTPLALEDLSIGQSAELTRLVDDRTVMDFAAVSGDHNPLHVDEEYAKASPFRGRIAHGALIASYLSGVLGNQLPGPGAIFLRMDINFQRPVRVGDTVTARARVEAVDVKSRLVTLDCDCRVGDRTVMTAKATVMVRARRRKDG
ncbi:MAG: MaoC family dehydratase [Maricaulaceae bacterium]|nr:MaoC family dehydratase [Maricaulaceae bacterium]